MINVLNSSKRPVIVAGNGLRGCLPAFKKLVEHLQIPIIPTWKAMDIISNDDPLYAGRAGGMGDRHGNLTMQSSDLLLCLGSRLDFSITGFDRSEWAVNATKIVVELDPAEITKLGDLPQLVPVIADVSLVIDALLKRTDEIKITDLTEWKAFISQWKGKYPITASVNELTTYALMQSLSAHLPEGAYIAPCSAGTTAEIFFQAFIVKPGQTIRSSHGLGSMGFEIPNAIGMCIASGKKDVVCVAGDGGMQLNIQELSVISGRSLPIKIFVVNNNGYASIRNLQNNHFSGRYIGCDTNSGLFLPDMCALASAYGLKYFHSDTLETLNESVQQALHTKGPVICEIVVDKECFLSLRTSTKIMPDGSIKSSPLENQFPFLPDDEAEKNIIK
jgi:acetolactate synthase-1/2/3 large subunit